MKTNRVWRTIVPVLALAVTAVQAAPPEQTPPRKAVPKVALEYKRDSKARALRDDAPPREVPDVPDDLKIAVQVQRVRTPPPRQDVEAQGTQAGERMAQEAVNEWAWRQYWRAGFQRGARESLQDPRPSTWDRNEGFRYGRLDPRALAIGGEIAQGAAADAAAGMAAESVRAQFTDLTRLPRRNAALPGGVSPARYIPAGPWAESPVFDDVFVGIPLAMAPGLGREARTALDGWDVQPASLTREAAAGRVYDGAWKDAAFAFSVWRDRSRPGSNWSRFGPGERERFRMAFFASFDEELASTDLRPAYAGYRVGFADGWRYGCAVTAEWAYRQGYAAGFDDGVRAAAALSFPFLLDKAYAAAYDREFRVWSDNPMPALEALSVVDGNDDGVIEPGERVALTGSVINFGGAPGLVDVRVNGSILEAPEAAGVRVAARSRAPLPRLPLRIDAGVPARTRADVEVAAGDAHERFSVYVSRPLELQDPIVEADPLGGRVRVIVAVANRSRNPLRADTAIFDGAGARRDRLDVPAGSTARTEAVYEGLRPLDVIAGTPRWTATVVQNGVENDARTIDLAPAATDLTNPDLLTYMLEMAHSRQVSPRDVRDARALLLDRMRADWARSVAMNGNPYKTDYEEGSASTALGELVRAIGGSRGFANRNVFGGAGADIAAMAEDLPGAHPLLRKWMKRLAKRVG